MKNESNECLMETEPELDHELIQDIQGRMILHWNYRNLKEIPLEVLNHGEHIEEIYLKRNCLEKLPPDIGKLCNLTNLYLVGNQLEVLPSEIGTLSNLRILDVSENYMRELPNAIGDLKFLEGLLLTHNQLEELPKCFKNLHRLKQLEISGNRIHTLPEEVFEGLKSLEELGTDRNPISSIPRNICLLRNLRYFSACRCNLLLIPSLPFHQLLHGSCRVGKTRSTSAILNKNLQFLFDGNPRLNYIPYWALQLLGTNVECFGCGLEPGESDNGGANPHVATAAQQAQTQLQLYTYRSDVNRPKMKLNFKGKRRTLHFDEDLIHLHHYGYNEEASEGSVKIMITTLLELCLRQVHHLGLLDRPGGNQWNAKPVVEPLIVPQKAGEPLINIRGDLHERKDPDNGSCFTFKAASQSSSSSSLRKVGENHEAGITEQRPTETSNNTTTTTTQLLNDTTSIPKATRTFEKNVEENSILPTNLARILMKGPVARCFECMRPIFTETWPVIFHIPRLGLDLDANPAQPRANNDDENRLRGDWDDRQIDGRLSIGCTHFCSGGCVARFRTKAQFASNLLLNDLRCIVNDEIPWVQI